MKTNRGFEFITTMIVVLFVTLITTTVEASVDSYSPECRNSDCHDEQMCKNNICINVCETRPSFIVKNAICSGHDHIPHWDCPTGYIGNPSYECTKPCAQHEDCVSSDLCVKKKCVFGCSYSRCYLNQYCKTINHKNYCLSIN